MPDTRLDFIHRYIPAKTASAHTLLLLHGTGGDEEDLLSIGAQIGETAGLLSPRGKVLESGMPRFFRRLSPGVFDIKDLHFRTRELAEFVQSSARHYAFDPASVIALGYSNGANIAASLLLQEPGVLAGAILLRPMIPFVPDVAPDLSGVPILIAGGRRDPIVAPEETNRLVELLRKAGAAVTVHWSPQGHQLTADELQEARRWMAGLPALTRFPSGE